MSPSDSQSPADVPPTPDRLYLSPADPIAEAGRKVIAYHFDDMQRNAPGTRLGDDVEALHDMRVATRRLRAAYRVFGQWFDGPEHDTLRKGLKRTGRALGRVRDLDVFLEGLIAYQMDWPADGQAGLAPLRAYADHRHARARRKLLTWLDSDDYQEFLQQMTQFVSRSRNEASPAAPPVSEAAPPLIMKHYAIVISYHHLAGASLETLHALRIDCKRLRYALEFFESVLDPASADLIAMITTLQDHLGALNDAHVARQFTDKMLRWAHQKIDRAAKRSSAWPYPSGNPPDLHEIEAYRASREAIIKERRRTLPALWRQFDSAQTQAKLLQAVAALQKRDTE